MSNAPDFGRKWNQRCNAPEAPLADTEAMFRLLFERSHDAIWLFDPQAAVFVDCNQAAVDLMRSNTKQKLLGTNPADLSPEFQSDGQRSRDKAAALAKLVSEKGSHRFEWAARRLDGTEVPLEVSLTAVQFAGRDLHVVISRDITERKQAEDEIRRLNALLERRVAERTAELAASEARLRTLVEHAPEAIVVFDGETTQFVTVNENATRLYGLKAEALCQMTPADVSPPVQPDGRPSALAAREKIDRALAGETPVFEWLHQHSSGRLIPCEVRLVQLPGEGRKLLRASIIDNTERRRREKIQQATYQISEAVHAAADLQSLYARIHTIIKGLMPADNFYLAILNPATETIWFPYFVDESSATPGPRQVGTGLTGYVLRTGKPLLVGPEMNVRKRRVGNEVTFAGFEDIRYVESGQPAAIWLGVPLSLGGRPFGVMAVQDYHHPHAYGEGEKQILTFVAEQTALAIERKRAEQALLKRTEQMRRHRNALLELALLDKSNLQAALATICARLATALNVARVGYWSLQDEGAALLCETLYLLERGGIEPSAKGTRVAAQDCPSYFAALAAKEPIVAHHAETHRHTRELAQSYLRPLGITSMLDVPVWLHGKLVGVLCHEHVGEPRQWTAEEIDFAASVANMVSLSIEAAQRARSEQALRESEQKFRALFEASSQGVMLHDEERFLEVNPATLRIMGYHNAEEIIGKHPGDTSPPTQPNGESSAVLARRHIAECMEKGSARFDWVARSAKGGEVPLEVILTRIEMGGRQIIQAVINDISERKKAEAELHKALAREKELGQLKNNFVSMVSHEFRTPLGIIQSSAEILGDYLDQLGAEERREHLQSITKNTRRMAELMEEVLVLGRLDAGKMDFQPAPLDLRGVCRRLVDEVLSATDGRCPIEWAVGPVPPEAQADERLVRHIFTNLLTNAVKYSEPGKPVRLSLRQEGREGVWQVADRGIGIPEADQPWLFTAFHRGRNVGHRPGTGLGLVIVKRCVELHGGQIAIESKAGDGTTVTVRLPVFL
jgi:PAS domain S-box-containing protein